MQAQPAPAVRSSAEGDFVIKNFRFTSGETLPELRIHYRTYGTPVRNAQGVVTNAVLIMHGTGGTGAQFVGRGFAGELFGPGQPLDARGTSSSCPTTSATGNRASPATACARGFPRYGYVDMVEAEYRLVTEGLGVNHLRLVMGTSMGGMHTWLWGERYPDFMDALMPLASLPTQIAGRNRVWRRIVIDAIRNDPEWKNGEYTDAAAEPAHGGPDAVAHRQQPDPAAEGRAHARRRRSRHRSSMWRATSRPATPTTSSTRSRRRATTIPVPDLEKIKAPLVAINSADDLINPPELRILEREIKRVPNGRAIVLPLSDKTAGHGTHTLAALWKAHLVALLRATER